MRIFQNDNDAGDYRGDVRHGDWRNDGTGYSYDPLPAMNHAFIPDDETPTDLLERWKMHHLGDYWDDLAAAVLRLTRDPYIPRKPCGIANHFPDTGKQGHGSPAERQMGGTIA